MHHRASIVGSVQMLDLGQAILHKVVLHAGLDVVPKNGHMFIPVRS